ncbi:uncharacterized protein LOC120416979 [Culex pipiens pallens]|nr:uncharacterized protein LOC120416979 [Culex pipiens pallens]
MADEMATLLKREQKIHDMLDLIEKFVENYKAADHYNQLRVRLDSLEKLQVKFYELRDRIEVLQDAEPEKKTTTAATTEAVGTGGDPGGDGVKQEDLTVGDPNFQAIQDFEDRYCALMGDLLFLRDGNLTQTTKELVQPAQQLYSKVKLPEITLPRFSGDIYEWIAFRDSFKSLIHNNPQLTPMDKYTYLRSSVTGSAAAEISTVDFSAETYEVAWEVLQKKYEIKKLIVKAYLDAIFSIEPLKKESYDGLSFLVSQFEKNLLMLQKLDEDTTGWSTILGYMVFTKLDPSTLRQWETHYCCNDVPSYEELIAYLRNQCCVLQSIAQQKTAGTDQRQSKPSVCHTLVRSSGRCSLCGGEPWHSPFHCDKFQKMLLTERNEVVLRSKLCRNCLSPGHLARACTRGVCHHCRQKHHSMLHSGLLQSRNSAPPQQTRPPQAITQQRQPPYRPTNTNQQPRNQNTSQNNTNTASGSQSTPPPSTPTQNLTNTAQTPSTSHTYTAFPTTPTPNVILSTAIVMLKDKHGRSMQARALLDSCSQQCLMTTSFAKKLNFEKFSASLSVQGIGSSLSHATKLVRADVEPRSQAISEFREEMLFYVLPKLTVALPTATVNPTQWKLPERSVLADPNFFESGPIDVIIGAEHYLNLLENGRLLATDDGPTLQNTVFGWIISGRVPNSSPLEAVAMAYVCTNEELQEQLTRFWELETCWTKSKLSTVESACEVHFEATTVRDATGRFVVTLPKKVSALEQLGDSRTTAIKRYLGLERRLSANPELKKQYSDFIHEYLNLGHMREVVDEGEGVAYYLPHHAVLRPDSSTTKLRVVFDASCRSSTGVSLNDVLLVGPVVQDDLIDITLRFRLHRYAIVADIEKMYRMIKVQEPDQRLQRIFWRDSTDEFLRIFELTTVTYGTASAPYLATKCLQKLAEAGAETHPVAAQVVKNDFYVDDMTTGVQSIEQGKQLVHEMVQLMESAGLSLRKWNSNSREILMNVPESLRDCRALLDMDTSSSTVKTLGTIWEPRTDRFMFTTPKWIEVPVITKRVVASEAARLFDPYGLLQPVVVLAKIFMQRLWELKLNWNDALNEEMQEEWRDFRRNLMGLDGITVPRWVGIGDDNEAVELHGFCDASMVAYGACIYVRTVAKDRSVSVRLLISKSRVAPLDNQKRKNKKQSIPRLELTSALLLAHLYHKVISACPSLKSAKAYFWTDSMISKCQISAPPSRWKDFIANRVSEIQHLTPMENWHHVPGVENPADIVSRGMIPALLRYETLWWNGPRWLILDKVNWPQPVPVNEADLDPEVLEVRGPVAAVLPVVGPNEIFGVRSKITDLVRISAIWLRFRFNAQAKNRNCRRTGPLSVDELTGALHALVRLSQRDSFAQELADLTARRRVRDNSRIASLNPQLVDGILCVGGRLRHASISGTRKHPMIIDHKHPFAVIVMEYYHRSMFHVGQQALVSAVRGRFWPTNARNLARQVIHRCVDCYRVKPKVHEQLMADLPPERVLPSTPFSKVGVDYCGPFHIVYPHRRAQPIKSFVAIFVCLVTKAVHLELVADLTTQAFLAALKRFTARRGKPSVIMCDNAKNFVGAQRELEDLRRLFNNQVSQEKIINEAANEEITFKFIPARSPNFGGLWESAVRSFKLLFKRTIGTHNLVYDQMQTLLAQVEAVLNSRPLTPLSSDPSDFEALTPGHFLIHRPLTAIPEPNLDSVPSNRLSAWQHVQHFMQTLWRKWSQQYLSDLNNRTKWAKQKENVKVGTMVLLKEDNQQPMSWPLGRITHIHPGQDGNVRVVTVRTKDGSYNRGISKICVLPIRDNDSA